MPENAMSTVKGNAVPSSLGMIIDGLPYSLMMEDCMPNAFTIALEASELTTDRVEPNPYRISEGSGIRNMRKAIENASCRMVCGLKRMSNKPATNIGRANMWYSNGWKV